MLSGFVAEFLGKMRKLHFKDGSIVGVFRAFLRIGGGCFIHAGALIKKQMVGYKINRLK